MTLGIQIRDARKAAGLTQKQLSEKVFVCKDLISSLESGRKKSTSLTVLQLIGKELNIRFEI
jgi:transcriptional regulator with XRE-family HTH domain